MSSFVYLIALAFFVTATCVALAFALWPSSPLPLIGELTPSSFTLLVGNGQDAPFIDSSTSVPPIPYPFVISGDKISVTYSFTLHAASPAHPSLPVLIFLPTNATDVNTILTISTKPLPPGENGLNIIQHNMNTLALQYLPSGTLLVGSDLTTNFTLIFMVVYTVVP